MRRPGKKIGLLDHMGGGNLGDDATQTAVILNIKRRWPDCEICAFSMNPIDTQSRHGILSYPIRAKLWALGDQSTPSRLGLRQRLKNAVRKYEIAYKLLRIFNYAFYELPRNLFHELSFLTKSFSILQTFDQLIISGGGQLLDQYGGPWGFPYTIAKWVLLAKLAQVECIVLNVGAGPLSHPLSKYFIKRALSQSIYVSFRDMQSKALIREIGFNGEANVFPDCVYSLDVTAFSRNSDSSQSEVTVGIGIMAYGDPRVYPEHDRTIYDRLIHNLDLLGSWLVTNKYRISLFCTDIGVDPPAVKDLETRLRISFDTSDHPYADLPLATSIGSNEDLFLSMTKMDYVVTCRFHGVIFAHMLNLPVLAISHHPKIVTLMNDLGLSEYCVDIRSCDIHVLTEKFKLLIRNGPSIKRHMAETLAANQRELSSQFNNLFPEDAPESIIKTESRLQALYP